MRRWLTAFLVASAAASVGAQTPPPAPPDIYIKEDDSLVITVPNLTRVAVGDPSVIDVTIVSPHEVLVQGRPISLTGTPAAAFRTFQEVVQTLSQAEGAASGAAPSQQGGEAAPAAAPPGAGATEKVRAFFAVSNLYVWAGEQRYVYRAVVVNVTDEDARPPYLEGYRIDVVPDRLILSGIAESEERRDAAGRILEALGFRVENKITVLDRPLIGAISKPPRDLVYLAIQHGLLLQGMTREEAEASIGAAPIGPPRLIREGSVTFQEYDYKSYVVRYFDNQVVSFRRYVDLEATRVAGRPAEVTQAGSNEAYRLYRLRYVNFGQIKPIFEAVLPGRWENVNPTSNHIVVRAAPEALAALDRLVEQADIPEFQSRITISRAPAPPPTIRGGGGAVIDEGPKDIAIIRLTGVSPAEQERIIEELQDLAKRIKVRRVSSGAAGVGGAGTGVTVDLEETELNLQAIRDTLVIIEAPGIIDVLLSYLAGRIERMGFEDVQIAIRAGQPVRGMTLEQLNAALGRAPVGSPKPIRQPDGSIIWEYDYGDRVARFQDGRLLDNAPPKDKRMPSEATLERLVSLGQIVEGMTQEQVERALGGETPTTVTYDVDFDGREIWEYTYPSYYVRYREGRVLDFVPQTKPAEDTTPIQITRLFTPRSRTAEDIRNVVSTFISDTTYGPLPGRTVIDSATNTLIVTHYPANMDEIAKYIRLLDEQSAYQVMIEARFVELNREAIRRLGISWNVQGQNPQGNRPFVTVNRSGSVSNPAGTAGTGIGVASVGGISFGVLDANSFRFGTISIQDVDIAIQALEDENMAKVLSAPRVVTVQNKQAVLKSVQTVVDVTVDAPTVTSTGTVTPGATTFTPKEVGVTLTVKPTVGRDGIITMELSPEVSSLVQTIPTANGGQFNIIDKRTVTSTVQVRSGTTLVIGGLLTQNNRHGSNRVPVLGRIPLLGRLFRSDQVTQDEVDLVIFINARIVSADGGRVPPELEGAEPPPPADLTSAR